MKNTKKIINFSFIFMLLCLMYSNKNVQASEVGKLASDILLPNSSGQQISLASQKGKLVLVYFWASWDPNSRINNPNLAIIQQKYNNVQFKTAKGFDIFSVSLDKDANEWLNAAKADGLLTQYCTNDKKSRYVNPYNVSTLPASFLVNEKGYIVGKNLSMTELDQMLAAQASYYFAEETTTTTAPVSTTTTTQNVQNTTGLPYTTPPLIGGGRAETTTITSVADEAATQQAAEKDVTYYTTKYISTDGTALVDNAYSAYKTPFEAKAKKGNTTTVAQPVTVAPPTTIIEPTPTQVQVEPTQQVQDRTANLSADNAYRIQLGAFQTLNFEQFYGVADYGSITTEIDDNDLKRVLIGDYHTKAQMQTALQAIKVSGFPDAFAVLYNGHNRVSEMSKKTVPATMNTTTTSYATQVKPSTSQTTTSFVQPASPATYSTGNNYVQSQTTTQQTVTQTASPSVVTVFPAQTATTTYQSGTGGSYTNVNRNTQPQQYNQNQGTYYDNNFSWYPDGQTSTNRNVYQSPSYATNPAASTTTQTRPATYNRTQGQTKPATYNRTQGQTRANTTKTNTNTRGRANNRANKPQTYNANTATTKSVSQTKKEEEDCNCKQLKAENAAATAELEKLKSTKKLDKSLDKYLEGYDYWSVSESDSKKLSKKQERERKRKAKQERKKRKKRK
ncbi:MAG: thioredoxin-like domain-containing protein [Chitinophagales bacterium]